MEINNRQSNDSNDGNEDKKSMAQTKGSSDANKCPICLNFIANRSLTDTCLHEFCFDCINEWSLQHNRCPSCRQIYWNILFNIVSDEIFEQMPVNAPEDEGINDILYRFVLFIQLMAIRNRMIQERDRIVRELQVLNRRLERSKARNTKSIREDIQDLERERERLEAHINLLELSAREVNPTQMNAFINHQNNDINENNEMPGNESNDSLPSLESIVSISSNDSGHESNIEGDNEEDNGEDSDSESSDDYEERNSRPKKKRNNWRNSQKRNTN
jgi:hypothetical protein